MVLSSLRFVVLVALVALFSKGFISIVKGSVVMHSNIANSYVK